MEKFYDINIIPEMLKIFNVKEIVISGVSDKNLITNIFKCDANFTLLNSNDSNSIAGNPLEILQSCKNYDAIFIDDDSNWFTVYNQLQIIKNNNKNFPLVFICNNNFPNKRRDSYSIPEKIPLEFRHSYTADLPICYNGEKIVINDGFYHACDENSPKNGVLTAIEDFLNENHHIGMMNINFIKEISILYLKIPVNQKRISIISKNIQNQEIKNMNYSDKLIENQLLVSYINKYMSPNENLNSLEVEISEKEGIINDFKNELNYRNNEIDLKEAKIDSFESKLSLKDSQIKNMESKLLNSNNKIHNLKNELHNAKNDLNLVNQKINEKDIEINQLKNDFKQKVSDYDNQIDLMRDDFNKKESNYVGEINSLNDVSFQKEENYINKINSLTSVFNQKEANYENKINSLNNEFKQMETSYENKINSLTSEINIKDQNFKINENAHDNVVAKKNAQIDSLKNDLIQKENSFSIKEREFNHQINNKDKTIKQKEDQIKIKQFELDTIQSSYIKQLHELDTNNYCISCFKDEISNNHLEIKYLKNNTVIKRILSPFAYLLLIFKSDLKEISLNLKLYKSLKNSKCFDIGFYLNNNKDLIDSKWCKYFSPELHYVCKGFDEKRQFNKKYFNRNSKKDLFEYLLICDK